MRLKNNDMFTGEATLVMTGFENNLSTTRTIRLTKGDKEIIAFFNPSVSKQQSVTAASTKLNQNNCQLIATSYGTEPTLTGTGTSLSVTLPAHSFAVFATNSVADVDEISSDITDKQISVYTETGRIVVNGNYQNAEVFDMYGRLQPSLEVPAGLYIVRVDGTPFKVLVK
jgi:hypothetical protein